MCDDEDDDASVDKQDNFSSGTPWTKDTRRSPIL